MGHSEFRVDRIRSLLDPFLSLLYFSALNSPLAIGKDKLIIPVG